MTGAPPPSNTHYARVPPVGVNTVTPTCPPYPYDPSPSEATNLAPCARSISLALCARVSRIGMYIYINILVYIYIYI